MRQSKASYLPDTCASLDHLPKIEGYDFDNGFDLEKFISAYSTTGMQATNLGMAVHAINSMIREKATIFLSITSNMVSSGVRDIIRYLVQRRIVSVIVTSAGGIEEDAIKSIAPFRLGSFNADGRMLFEKGVNRIGNIFVTNDRYTEFEKFMRPVLAEAYRRQHSSKRPLSGSELIGIISEKIDDKKSILYWAKRNVVRIFCPALIDGALGDMIFFEKQRHDDFYIDVTKDIKDIVNISLNAGKTGIIALGGGSAKHFALNAQIFREGCDYAVFINSGSEHDGSDSGAAPSEAVSWGKIKANAQMVKVHGDATILFPLVVAGVLENNLKRPSAKKDKKKNKTRAIIPKRAVQKAS